MENTDREINKKKNMKAQGQHKKRKDTIKQEIESI